MIKSSNKEPSKSMSWKVLETVMSHLELPNYPRSTFDLAVFGGKFIMEIANWEKIGLLAVVLLFLIRQYLAGQKTMPHKKKLN